MYINDAFNLIFTHQQLSKDWLLGFLSDCHCNDWSFETYIVRVSDFKEVTNKELCQVIWGIIIKNFMHKYSFIVSELLR